MSGVKSILGPTGHTLATVVKQRRLALGLSFAQLSRRLIRSGRDIPTLGLRRIESGHRHVDVDDLVALAVALETSPITLLMPPDVGPSAAVKLTGIAHDVLAERAWNWLNASYPLSGATMAFYHAALPQWERGRLEEQIGVVRTER